MGGGLRFGARRFLFGKKKRGSFSKNWVVFGEESGGLGKIRCFLFGNMVGVGVEVGW